VAPWPLEMSAVILRGVRGERERWMAGLVAMSVPARSDHRIQRPVNVCRHRRNRHRNARESVFQQEEYAQVAHLP